jgi:hypothetical protein
VKGVWWYCEGLEDPAKICFIHEMVKEHKLDFIVLREARKANFAIPFIKHLSWGG